MASISLANYLKNINERDVISPRIFCFKFSFKNPKCFPITILIVSRAIRTTYNGSTRKNTETATTKARGSAVGRGERAEVDRQGTE